MALILGKHSISSATHYKWKAKYSGVEVPDLKHMWELELENTAIKDVLNYCHLPGLGVNDKTSDCYTSSLENPIRMSILSGPIADTGWKCSTLAAESIEQLQQLTDDYKALRH